MSDFPLENFILKSLWPFVNDSMFVFHSTGLWILEQILQDVPKDRHVGCCLSPAPRVKSFVVVSIVSDDIFSVAASDITKVVPLRPGFHTLVSNEWKTGRLVICIRI